MQPLRPNTLDVSIADRATPGPADRFVELGNAEVRNRAQSATWQQALQSAIRSVDDLLNALALRAEDLPALDRDSPFPLLVPQEFVRRMKPGDPQDPLLLQVLPLAAERKPAAGYVVDPVGDGPCETVSGMLHKYPGRVLLIASGMCAVHCRYCFRRHYPYETSPKGMEAWQPAWDAIAADDSLEEVILSGGDPLSVGNARLIQWIETIEGIGHIKRLRIHTRFPVMIPARIDSGLCERLQQSRLAVWMVLHINHPNEIDDDVVSAVERLRRSGVSLLNQAVLLRGINDRLEVQRALCQRLVNIGVQPYYLHQLDPVEGASHFECDSDLGVRLVRELRETLSGYAVPRFVQEIPGRNSKTLLE
ncbi:MAG: EF-P beta-lysylation protein EpmB [Planctomycetota bacterium]